MPLLASLTPFSRLLFSILLAISSFAIVFLLAMLLAVPLFGVSLMEMIGLIAAPDNPAGIRLLQYFQAVQGIGLFIIPALLAGFLFARKPFVFLGGDRAGAWQHYLLTLLVMFATLPAINWLISVNETMELPASLDWLETWMIETEDEAARLTEIFMQMPSFGAFLFNLFLIAVIPALGEEMMFRGLVQRLLADWLKNIHLAIIVSALLFSAMHMQFYGFLPRFALGLLLGYLFYWSGSLWVAVAAHFIQNGTVVIVTYLGEQGLIGGDYEQFGVTSNPWIIVASVALTGMLCFLFYRRRYVSPESPSRTLDYFTPSDNSAG
jgi:membrane protease YdiL (CAAX protease family)